MVVTVEEHQRVMICQMCLRCWLSRTTWRLRRLLAEPPACLTLAWPPSRSCTWAWDFSDTSSTESIPKEALRSTYRKRTCECEILEFLDFPLSRPRIFVVFTNFSRCSLAQAVKLLFAFAIFISYALQAYVPVDIIWNTYMKRRIQNWDKATMEYLLRISVVVVTCKYLDNTPQFTVFICLWTKHVRRHWVQL